MPRTPTAPTGDRFFARLDKFECECPHCGRVIYSAMDARAHTVRESTISGRRAVRLSPRSRRQYDSAWNPISQRLKCPWCGVVYMAGLLLHPVSIAQRRQLDPPPDVLPTARQLAECRRKAGGLHATEPYTTGGPVNVLVLNPCSCAESQGTCPVHGNARAAEASAGASSEVSG